MILPHDSFVDFDDVLNIGSLNSTPSNRNPASEDAALQCITDLVDCCGTESGTVRTEHGDWYFPDGTRVGLFIISRYKTRFLVNRGPNEVINGQQFNGSVHLFRRFSSIPQRGCFRCELPSAANPSVNQTIYVNICELIILLLLGTHDRLSSIHSEFWIFFQCSSCNYFFIRF